MKAVLDTVTSDFTFTETDGTVHALAFLKKALQEDFDATRSIPTHRFDILRLQSKGNEALVTVTETRRWIAAYKPASLHTYEEIVTSQDRWVRTGDKWKTANTKWISDQATKDGVPITTSGITSKTISKQKSVFFISALIVLVVLCLVILVYAKNTGRLRRRGIFPK